MKLGKDFELLLHVGEGVMKFVLVYIITDIVNGYTYFWKQFRNMCEVLHIEFIFFDQFYFGDSKIESNSRYDKKTLGLIMFQYYLS